MKKDLKKHQLPVPPSNPNNIIKFGLSILIIVFIAAGGWMAYAPLAASSVAPGKVITSTAKISIQHLEGGIIKKIFVKDGDFIKKGEPLMKLDDVQTKAQIAQVKNQILGYKSLLESKQKRISSLNQEIKELQKLYKQKLIDNKRLRELQKEKVMVEGDIANTKAQIAKTKEQNIILKDRLARSVITSPRDGTVMGIDNHSVGEVVAPGRKIFEIIPADSKFLILANVMPKDIDKVKIGQTSKISFPAFDMKSLQPVEGKVIYISADSIENPKMRASFYQAKVELTSKGTKELKDNNLTLVTGMPAVVMIKIGKRTMLEYLVKPFKDMFRKSFNEE